MKRFSILLAAVSGLSGTAYAGPLTNGAYSLVTIRGCTAGDTSSDACFGGYGSPLAQASTGHRIAGVASSNYDGGIGQSISTVDYTGVYGESKARSEYAGPLEMPVLGVATQASYASATAINGNPLAGFRLGSHAYNYQTYEYDGTSASPFSLEINLHYIVSGNPAPDSEGYSDPGDGGIVAEIILFDPAVAFAPIAGVDYPDAYGNDLTGSPAQLLAAHLTGGPCQAGALGWASAASGVAAGEVTTSFKLSTGLNQDGSCTDSGQALSLAPGQQFGILAILHSYSSRGGFADSYGTMSVALDPDLPPEVTQQLNNSLFSATDAEDVPEPAMLGLFGLGALGLGLARRRCA